MRGQPDIWGEINEDEIIKTAREAAEKKGYALYADYNEYLRQLIRQRKLKPTDGGLFRTSIERILIADGWKYIPGRLYFPARFLPYRNKGKLHVRPD